MGRAYGLVDRVSAVQEVESSTPTGGAFANDFSNPTDQVCSDLEKSGIRVAMGYCSVTERRRWRPPYQIGKNVLYICTQNTTHIEVMCLIWFRTLER